MSFRLYDSHTREQVTALRAAGKTYGEIQQQFPIPKSTLSAWLGEKYKHLFSRSVQLTHLKKIRKLAAVALRRARNQRHALATERAHSSTRAILLADKDILKALLAMLHWAEGTKRDGAGLRFANTDQRMMLLYLLLLRKCFLIDEKRLRVRLHIHYYHEKKKTIKFWSDLLGIPKTQFWKTYIKKRSEKKRFRKNAMGICFLYYPGDIIRKELLEMGYAIYAILSGHPPVV